MTNEEIERALKLAISDLSDCAQDQIIDYINRLKAENANLQKWKRRQQICNESNTERIMALEDEKEQIRKETAKEILHPLYEKADIGTHDENNDFAYVCLQFRSRILAIAKRYGVEVKE